MYAINKLVAVSILWCILLQNTAVGHPMHCHRSILKGILIGAMPHVRELQNRYERETYSPKCPHVLRMTDVPECNLTGMERLPLSLYRISKVVKVLENMAQDSLVQSNLDTFSIIQTELSKCEATKSQKGEVCLKRLMKKTEKVSEECLQRDVLFNLIWSLIEDVGFVLPGDHYIGLQKESQPGSPNEQSPKKRGKGKRKHKGKKNKAKPAARKQV